MRGECIVCKGLFQRGERIIEINGLRYCEACDEDMEENK